MLWLLKALMLYTPYRVDISVEIAGAAWDFPPSDLYGLAVTESTLQYNPPRFGPKGKRWGPPPLGKKWNYCGLMQIRGGAQPMGQPPHVRFPPCEVLILFPELSVWYAAMHLRGWSNRYGYPSGIENYNCGNADNDKCLASAGSFKRKVLRKARLYEKQLPRVLRSWYVRYIGTAQEVAWTLLNLEPAENVETKGL